MNLHAIAMRHLSRVHPSIEVIAVRCTGKQSTAGRLAYTYGNCEKAMAQKQFINGDEASVHDAHIQVDMQRKFFLALRGAGLQSGTRESGLGSDYLYEPASGDLWKVYNVAEDFKSVGWALYFCALQAPGTVLPGVLEALESSGLLGPAQAEIFRGKHGSIQHT